MFVIDLEKLQEMDWDDLMEACEPFEPDPDPGPQRCSAEVCCYNGYSGYQCSGEQCPVQQTWRSEAHPEVEHAQPVVGTLSLGPVRLDCPYVIYGNLTAKLPSHLRFLTLTQGEELVDFLSGLEQRCSQKGCGTLGCQDYLHQEMALAAWCRDNPAIYERQRAKLSDPSSFDLAEDEENFLADLFDEE